jgi:TonB family protein
LWLAAGIVAIAVAGGVAWMLLGGDGVAVSDAQVADSGSTVGAAPSTDIIGQAPLQPAPAAAGSVDQTSTLPSRPASASSARESATAPAKPEGQRSPPDRPREEPARPLDRQASAPPPAPPQRPVQVAQRPASGDNTGSTANAPVPLPVEESRSARSAAPDSQPAKIEPVDRPSSTVARSATEAAAPKSSAPEPPAASAETRPASSGSTGPLTQSSAPFQRGDLIREGDTNVVPPILESVPEPRMPALAERQRREAMILVRVLVDETGSVASAEIQDTDPSKRIFHAEALRVARHASFEPGTKDGIPGKMYSTLPVRFRAGG